MARPASLTTDKPEERATETPATRRTGRPCSTCQHPRRREIDARLAAGEGVAFVARAFCVSAGALARHRDHHLPADLPAATRPAEGEAKGSREPVKVTLPDDADIMAELERLNRFCNGLLGRAVRENDLRLARSVAAEIRLQLELKGRLRGELNEAPAVVVIDRDALIAKHDAQLARLAPPRPVIDMEAGQ